MAQTKAEATAQIEAAKQEIATQTVVARTQLEQDAQAMAATISASILHRPVTAPGGN